MAANEKRPAGFFLYPQRVRAVCAMLTPGDAGRLLLSLCDYVESGEIPAPRKKSLDACFQLLREDIDRDAARYREICEMRRAHANKRWHSAPSGSDAYACSSMQEHAYTTQPNPSQRNPTQHNPSQHNPSQHNPTQPNPTQPNPTQPNPTQPNPTQPNPTQPSAPPGDAASAAPAHTTFVKGEPYARSGNSHPPSAVRGTVIR